LLYGSTIVGEPPNPMYIINNALRIDDQLVPNVGVSQALARLRT
jgi:hypothetical protein